MSIAVVMTQLLSGPSNWHVFGTDGRRILCVPQSDMDPALLRYADESTHLIIGSGHTPGFSFWFPPDLTQSHIDNYSVIPGFTGYPYVNALSGTVGFLGKDDEARLGSAMRARNIDDEWYARSACPHPFVKPLASASMYEIKCSANADYGAIWDRLPDHRIAMPNPNDFVVATCRYETIQLGPYKGRALKNCARIVKIDHFLIDYRFQEENAPLVSRLDLFIRARLSRWRENCSNSI